MTRTLEIEDLYRFGYLSDLQISPSGSTAAWVETHLDRESDAYVSHIWLLDTASSSIPQCFSTKPTSAPRWISDNELIFLSPDERGSMQFFRGTLNGSPACQIGIVEHGVLLPSLSPDGKKVAFISRTGPLRSPLAPVEINTLHYKSDAEKGIKESAPRHLFVLDLETKTTERCTPPGFVLEASGWYDFSCVSWSPDSKKLVFSSAVQDDHERDLAPWKADLFLFHIETKVIETLTQGNMVTMKPVFSQNGESIYFIGHRNERKRATNLGLHQLKNGAIQSLLPDFKGTLTDFALSDSALGSNEATLCELPDGRVCFLASLEGDISLFAVDPQTKAIELFAGGRRRVYDFSVSCDGEKILLLSSDVSTPCWVSQYLPTLAAESLLVDTNVGLLSELCLGTVEEFWYSSNDGFRQQGFLLYPPGFSSEKKKYPVVLEIHGGPFTLYANTFMFEFQLLAAQGICIAYCNPRGSRGYGDEMSSAIFGEYGRTDYDDIMIFYDKISALPFIDAQRAGVTGGSYGGYMTAIILTRSDRFRAAVAQRAVTNWVTMRATSDMGEASIEQMLLGRPPEEPFDAALAEASPINSVDAIRTPLLILHSERDMRVPIEQAEQLYSALKKRGADVSMVRFPDSNHGLSRNGRPSLRAARLRYIAEYFKKRLFV